MDELDEVSRRELLIKARQALEKDYQQAEADKKALEGQIEAKRKELREVLERVEAAKLQSETELKRIAVDTVHERERLQSQNDTLKVELSQLQAIRNREESAYRQDSTEYAAKINERRAALQEVSSHVVQEEAKLKVCQASIETIKHTLKKADL